MRFLLILCLGFGLFWAPLASGAQSELLGVGKEEGPGSTQFTFRFDRAPDHSVRVSGQRLDLLLKDAAVKGVLPPLPEDSALIRVAYARQGRDLLVSLLLRRAPSHVDSRTALSPERVVVDVFWGGDRLARPSLAVSRSGRNRAAGPSVLNLDELKSTYEGRWPEFFSDYESHVEVPIRQASYSLAAFPYLAQLKDHFGPSFPSEAEKVPAEALLGRLAEAESGADATPLVPLLRSHALMRLGRMQEAAAILEATRTVEPGHRVLAAYLRAFALASQDPYQALYALARGKAALERGGAMESAYRLLEAEISLATNRPDSALSLLPEEGGSPVILARRAEALSAMGRNAEALKIWETLEDASLLEERPEALRSYAQSLHQGGEYAGAAQAWEMLARQLAGRPGEGLALFLSGQSYFKGGERKLALLLFRQIKGRFAGREAALRSRMRLNDYAVLSAEENDRPRVAAEYAELASVARLREVREEAAFKQALLHYLRHDYGRAADQLMGFVRDFGSGDLRREADFLLTEVLPKVVEDYLQNGKEFEALILVEKNRELILSGMLKFDFLASLAQAFHRLGLLDRAYRVYLFMHDAAQGRPELEEVYLPMARFLLQSESMELVVRYADEYLTRFPDGEHAADLFALQLEALYAQDRIEQARELLRGAVPSSPAVELWSDRVLLASGELFGRAAAMAGQGLNVRQQQALFLRAEALFEGGSPDRARSMYEVLVESGAHGDQARYRLGQILTDVDRERALKYYAALVEEGTDPLWKRLAEEAAAALERKARFEPKL